MGSDDTSETQHDEDDMFRWRKNCERMKLKLHLCKLYKLQSEISMDMSWQDCENPWECSCPHLGGSWDTWPFSCWIVLRVSIITLSCSICGFYSTFNMDTLHRIVKFLFCFVKQDRFLYPQIPNPEKKCQHSRIKTQWEHEQTRIWRWNT